LNSRLESSAGDTYSGWCLHDEKTSVFWPKLDGISGVFWEKKMGRAGAFQDQISSHMFLHAMSPISRDRD
jgi:hypothetical protein